jgi:methylmalonyl-CoA mutase
MPDGLNLREEFPPVPTADWEAVIQKDLKGADYAKKLIWRTDEGIAVKPYYRREDLVPIQFPFGHRWQEQESVSYPAGAIRADRFHEAGAHAVQELGYALAEAVEKLAALPDLPIEFVFAVGSNYFFEIAKLRAARILWAQAAAAFGAPETTRIHVRTSRLNKSIYDTYTNLLRVTTEAMSAAIGGCDTLDVEAFGFSPHLAVNVQRILREESHLDAVTDPAAGSYYIEALTDALASAAWKLFQSVEAEGGYWKAHASIDKSLAETLAARRKAVSGRCRTLVGVNNYPNVTEKTPSAEPSGGIRLADPFEQLRQRTAAHAAKTGRYPKVLLLKRGDLKMRMARANFCFNFLGCAGFDLFESEDYAGTDADLIVLCSSDPEYLAIAQEVCPAVRVPLLVAGNPKDQIEALKAAGVQGFIHIASDAVQALTEWQE